MTAIVGILNKTGAVIAADSATTVPRDQGNRIYNNATKILRLSDTQPVAIMHFHHTEFMGIPISLLASMYRKKLGTRSFGTLKEYVDDFLSFIHKEPHCNDKSIQDKYLCLEIRTYYDKVREYSVPGLDDPMEESDHPLTDEEILEIKKARLIGGMNAIYEVLIEGEKTVREFEGFTFKQFQKYAKEDIDALIQLCEHDGLPTDMRAEWEEGLYKYLRSTFFFNGTGIVFVGYGEDEIFPSLIPIFVAGIMDGRLRYIFDPDDESRIDSDTRSVVRPFAQTDVMNTMLRGVSPAIIEKLDDITSDTLSNTKERIAQTLKDSGVSEDIISKVRELDLDEEQKQHDDQINDFIQQEYVEGLMDTVENFGITDMANMAESLVAMTSLQRHMTSAEETVGGPIDVAVITKEDGFVWLKHKDWNTEE